MVQAVYLKSVGTKEETKWLPAPQMVACMSLTCAEPSNMAFLNNWLSLFVYFVRAFNGADSFIQYEPCGEPKETHHSL